MSSAPDSLPNGEAVVHLDFAMPDVTWMPLSEPEQHLDELQHGRLLLFDKLANIKDGMQTSFGAQALQRRREH